MSIPPVKNYLPPLLSPVDIFVSCPGREPILQLGPFKIAGRMILETGSIKTMLADNCYTRCKILLVLLLTPLPTRPETSREGSYHQVKHILQLIQSASLVRPCHKTPFNAFPLDVR